MVSKIGVHHAANGKEYHGTLNVRQSSELYRCLAKRQILLSLVRQKSTCLYTNELIVCSKVDSQMLFYEGRGR